MVSATPPGARPPRTRKPGCAGCFEEPAPAACPRAGVVSVRAVWACGRGEAGRAGRRPRGSRSRGGPGVAFPPGAPGVSPAEASSEALTRRGPGVKARTVSPESRGRACGVGLGGAKVARAEPRRVGVLGEAAPEPPGASLPGGQGTRPSGRGESSLDPGLAARAPSRERRCGPQWPPVGSPCASPPGDPGGRPSVRRVRLPWQRCSEPSDEGTCRAEAALSWPVARGRLRGEAEEALAVA